VNTALPLAQMRQDLRQQLGADPQTLALAENLLDRRHKERVDAQKTQDDEAIATALRGLYGNGGRFSDLPAAVRMAIPPHALTEVMGKAQRIAKGDDVTDLWLYNKLTHQSDWLAGLSDAQFYALRTELSESDFKHFSKERAKLNGAASGAGGGGQGPEDLNSAAINAALDVRLHTIGLDPTPKDGSKEAMRIGAVRKFVNRQVLAAQREAGKKFGAGELDALLDRLFMQTALQGGWFSKTSTLMLGMTASDIPRADRKAIRDAYKRRGIAEPTDGQILEAFFMGEMTK